MSNSGLKLFVIADIDSETDLMPESLLPEALGTARSRPRLFLFTLIIHIIIPPSMGAHLRAGEEEEV